VPAGRVSAVGLLWRVRVSSAVWMCLSGGCCQRCAGGRGGLGGRGRPLCLDVARWSRFVIVILLQPCVDGRDGRDWPVLMVFV
jgi:hypothetical protein